MFRPFVVLLLSIASSAVHAQAVTALDDLGVRAKQAETCFDRSVREYVIQHPQTSARTGGETAIFIAEQIVKSIQYDVTTGMPKGPFFDLASEEFCRQFLLTPFLASLPAADSEQREKRKGGLAAIGTDEIESTSVFIKGYQNLIGKHYKGHSDLTRKALSNSKSDRQAFSSGATALIARAAQTPDLFRWSDERYHAHTPEYDPAVLQERHRQIEVGQTAFIDLMCSLQTEFAARSKTGSPDEGLFLLGVMSHAVQDLTYHRGMTLRQHSGLSYASKHNPDFPEGAAAQVREQEAVDNTSWVLKQSRGRLPEAIWRQLITWAPSGEFAFEKTAARVFGANNTPARQDIGTV